MFHQTAQTPYPSPQPSYYQQQQQQPAPPQQGHAQQQPAPSYASSTPNPKYYAHPAPGPQILHIYHSGPTHRHCQILSSDDKSTPLYTTTAHSSGLFSKPSILIHSASTAAVIATITLHTLTHKADLTIHNQPVDFNSSHEFHSLATGARFKWKKDGILSGGDMVCFDERQQRVAWYESSKWAMHKDGKIGVEGGVEGGLVDEIVVTMVAMLEVKRRENDRSAAAG